MKRKIVTMTIAFAMLLQGTTVVGATDLPEEQKTTIQTVKSNVTTQFQMVCMQNEKWEEAELIFDKALFDSDEQVSAYKFSIRKNGEELGYLIANTMPANNIVEYGEECFLDEAMNSVEETYDIKDTEQKVYYLGDLNYVIGGEDAAENEIYLNVSTSEFQECDEEELKEIEKGSSNPPDSGSDFITNPEIYEFGYSYCTASSVSGWDISYYKMSSFSSGGVCSPTAATNLLYYWYTSRGANYKKLMNSTWQKTFNTLYSNMGTTSSGTYDSQVALGLNKYLKSKGYGEVATYHSGTSNGKKLIPVINANRPCILLLHDHYKYGDHGVLALGYQQYVFEHWYGNDEDIYIRIMDGWTTRANRFVWGGCSGNWNYVTVSL